MRHGPTLAIIAMALAVTFGCSLTSPRPDLSRYYVLNSTLESRTPISDGAPVIGLGPVTMPGYLDHSEIVTRLGTNQLDLSDTDRWAEPIEQNFKNVLARDLSAATGAAEIVEYPWYNTVKLDYKVELAVSRFDSDQSGIATLDAKWLVRAGQNNQVLLTRTSNLTENADGTSTNAKVAALSAATGSLATEIGTAILQLRERDAPPTE
jgi:uncharacterized protein